MTLRSPSLVRVGMMNSCKCYSQGTPTSNTETRKVASQLFITLSVSLFAENIIMCSIEGFPRAKTSVLLSLSILTPDTYYKVFSGVANFILI